MRSIYTGFLLIIFLTASSQKTITKAELQDKIMGGWAGQTIGVSLGAPYEFRFNGSFIQDYQRLTWRKGYVRELMTKEPGIYDDLYMDLTFVDVFERYGLDAPVDSFANAFARAEYPLWHANQAARYNILNGIKAPASGHWKNNPHADDIDFQIESDFAGLMSPGMPQTAAAISDKIGHIMNYGDGWYGGVFVSTMYTQAFFEKDVPTIVNNALKAIPDDTKFYECIADVIRWRKQYPKDWRDTWMEIQKKWSTDMYCPDGVFHAFDIDATINAAYVVLGLLYGRGDLGLSMEITTRAGQDADCNPSTVAGILGTMMGYQKIPAIWKEGLDGAEDIPFKYTTISLHKAYDLGTKHALENIVRNGGNINGDLVTIPKQNIKPVAFEQGFETLSKVSEIKLDGKGLETADGEINFNFTGKALVIKGYSYKKNNDLPDRNVQLSIRIDDLPVQLVNLPTLFLQRKHDVYWNYTIKPGEHKVVIKLLDHAEGYGVVVPGVLVY
jgi:ADP-ribosylglycohydrolase